METFQTETGGLKHNDIAKYGSYRTKETILELYDRMAAADTARSPVRDADHATSRAGSTASGQKRCVIPRVRDACGMVQRQSARGAGLRAM